MKRFPTAKRRFIQSTVPSLLPACPGAISPIGKSQGRREWRAIAFGTALMLAVFSFSNSYGAADDAESGAASPGATAESRALTREERIRQHKDTIRKIIQERRDKQRQEQEKSTASAQSGESKKDESGSPASSTAPEEGLPPEGAPGGRPAGAIPGAPAQGIAPGAPGSPGSSGVPGGPGSPPGEDPSTGGPGGATGGGGGGSAASELGPAGIILMMTPMDVIATVGKRFSTKVELDNAAGLGMENLSLVLKYDKRFIAPLKIYDDEFRPMLAGAPRFENLAAQGKIIYEGKLSESRAPLKGAILTIVWEALRPTDYSSIDFEFAEQGPSTSITEKKTDQLGAAADPFDGVIGGSVLIKREEAANRAGLLQGKKEELTEFLIGTLNPPGSVGLALSRPVKTVRVGDIFDVPVLLRNPRALALDMVSLYIHFDPDILQVVDYDKGNWIRRGINIHDGGRHAEYPFDYMICNNALNARGLIDYRNGINHAQALPGGRFATIRLRAKAPAVSTSLEFIVNDRGGYPGTAVALYGKDYLNLSPPMSAPVCSFAVLPEEHK